MKFSQQENLTRFVFESQEEYINRAKVTTTISQIRIEFPGEFSLIIEKTPFFDIVPEEMSLIINLKEESEIQMFKLSSPPRLVFDVQKKDAVSMKMPVIPNAFVIDAGHGGYDFGITYGNESEKDICLNLAKDLGVVLSKKGRKIFYTHKVDQFVSIEDRIHLVNQKKPDIFISLHLSGTPNFVLYTPKFEEQEPEEITEYYSLSSRQRKYVSKSKAFSEFIGRSIKEEFESEVIYREMPLPLLNSTGSPCVLIELPSPKFVTYDAQMTEKFVNAIINGFINPDHGTKP